MNAVADACHAPRNWLELRGGEIVFRADPDDDIAKIESVLGKMSAVSAQPGTSLVGKMPVPEKR